MVPQLSPNTYTKCSPFRAVTGKASRLYYFSLLSKSPAKWIVITYPCDSDTLLSRQVIRISELGYENFKPSNIVLILQQRSRTDKPTIKSVIISWLEKKKSQILWELLKTTSSPSFRWRPRCANHNLFFFFFLADFFRTCASDFSEKEGLLVV